MVLAEPTTKTISQENASTTTVRIAVAMSESVFLIPHFARMAVNPAKTDDKIAAVNHISFSSIMRISTEKFVATCKICAGVKVYLQRISISCAYLGTCCPKNNPTTAWPSVNLPAKAQQAKAVLASPVPQKGLCRSRWQRHPWSHRSKWPRVLRFPYGFPYVYLPEKLSCQVKKRLICRNR